jgi:putative FmdB family regulatory protein
MPLYEYHCEDCESAFEALIAISAADRDTHPCPQCGGQARRILSSVNFGAATRPDSSQAAPRGARPDVTSLTLPPAARLCWMDDRSASRMAAYKVGRGAEYDDTVAARKELAAKEGAAPAVAPHPHSHSPLASPTVFENRRKAAQKAKIAESASITKPPTSAQ